MDSVHYWYRKLYDSFFRDLRFTVYANSEFLDEDPYIKFSLLSPKDKELISNRTITFCDQEPIYHYTIGSFSRESTSSELNENSKWLYGSYGIKYFVTSEISKEVTDFCAKKNFKSIYYFFHALAARDWYRNYWKQDINVVFEHEYLFVSYQHVVNHLRAHRIDFLCRLHEEDLAQHGLFSFKSPGVGELESIVQRVGENYTQPSLDIFHRQKHHLAEDRYIDTTQVNGALSTTVDIENSSKAFLQVVTETSFYHQKLHLTEKIFKPIVVKQPFLLLASPGNLRYLKDYGFKTFSDYWDESYDDLVDPGQRVGAVVDIIKRLSCLPTHELRDMKKDMSAILEHNWAHFYHDMQHIVAQEFIDNIKKAFGGLTKVPDENYTRLYKTLTF